MTDMRVSLCGIEMKNPVTTASGTFGSGMEFGEYVELERLGAVTTKGVSTVPWPGNEGVRIAETPSGMLNAIGLQNPGLSRFIERDLAFLKDRDVRVIVNVCGKTEEEYIEAVRILSLQERPDLLEINISCPNVHEGGIAFGTVPRAVEKITAGIKEAAGKPVIMKLSPNVTSIAEIARAAEAGGADALSLINTITGMKIDVNRRCFLLGNRTGGLSGPAIHPVAVRMVYEVSHAVKLPLIGMGGVRTAEDALELMMAGATMVAVGTASFNRPDACLRILQDMEEWCERQGVKRITELVGCV